jgi:hypothetical protein
MLRAYCMCLSGQPVAVVETYVGARLSRPVQFNVPHHVDKGHVKDFVTVSMSDDASEFQSRSNGHRGRD